MECSLGGNAQALNVDNWGLNPYSNGMLTWFILNHCSCSVLVCLNPYSNGMLTWLKNHEKRKDHDFLS